MQVLLLPLLPGRSKRPGERLAPRNRLTRRGVVAFELILMFPVLLILLLAIVEFSLMLAAVENVAFASRLGATKAADSGNAANLAIIVSNGTLKTEIDRCLKTAGFKTGSYQVKVQYFDVGLGSNQTLIAPGGIPCNCVVPTTHYPSTLDYVRVTVCAPLMQNVPDLLGTFGFSLKGRIIDHSTTFRFE